jgi:Circularly permutated YpsA SLOG family
MARVVRVVSGGQAGADQGGLEAARRLGIATGGWMPRGFMTETGPRPDLASLYGLKAHEAADYAARTEANVRESDGTLVFGDASPGSRATIAFCAAHGKPCLVLPWRAGAPLPSAADFRAWLAGHAINVLNVAGDRESDRSGIGEAARAFLLAALGE